MHDEEMAAGADSALVKHLTFLAFHAQQLQDDQEALETILTEITLTCDALESLFRASSQVLGDSFDRMGKEVLQLVIGLLDNELKRRRVLSSSYLEKSRKDSTEVCIDDDMDHMEIQHQHPKHDSCSTAYNPDAHLDADTLAYVGCDNSDDQLSMFFNTAEGDLLLRKATKILGHYARVGHATKVIAHYPCLLGVLLDLASFKPFCAVPWEARLSALWTIANLACNGDNMQMMVCTPGLISGLIDVASRTLHPSNSLETTMEIMRARSIVSRAFLNLSWSPENKFILSGNGTLLDLLLQLSVHRSGPLAQSRTVRGISLATRQHSVGALRNLAAAPRRIKMELCRYKNGQVLNVLTDVALNDPDSSVKDRAFAAIHNLAIHDTAAEMLSHPALVLALKTILQSDENTSLTEGESPKAHASATLLVLERSITPEMESYEVLRELLESFNPTSTSENGMRSGDDIDDDSLEAVEIAVV